MPASIKFRGKTYILYGASKTKHGAQKYAEHLRSVGLLARIVKPTGKNAFAWAIYGREKWAK